MGGTMRCEAWRIVGTAVLGSAAAALLLTGTTSASSATTHPYRTVTMIVRAMPGHQRAVSGALAAAGGHVVRVLPIADSVVVRISPSAIPQLRRSPDVAGVTPDAPLHFTSVDPTLGYDPSADEGSLYEITQIIGAQDSWKAGYTGQGIDVALIDTGVSPVPGLTSGNVVNGPDLSFDSQDPTLTNLDGFGHGTHMASLIAGRDAPAAPAAYADPTVFTGVAPDARVVSIKIGAADGAADVSQVIAGIDWVVQHRHEPGFNIRVLSLSFGTDSTQDYRIDPLAYAAERAWRAGIVVVVAGGNDGTSRKVLADPAMDPLVLAVGASDPGGTITPSDDTVPSFATRGNTRRHVDLVAPGVHVLGLRSPGSYVDTQYPDAQVGTRFVRGSGTSQATAITAGAVALFLQRYPTATPDQVKRAFMLKAVPLKSVRFTYRGSGSVQVRRAELGKLDRNASQPLTLDGTGIGSIEKARGSAHVTDGDVELTGEQDIFGAPWIGSLWATAAGLGTSWTDGTWNGNAWTGTGWSGSSWTSQTWAPATWTMSTWAGRRWTNDDWTGRRWTGGAWAIGAWR
ncbi:MAG: peptidase and in kexin sedolisin [Actinomycetia bacterium]|nr:peptidase and in kexin sedolisin [Actinomycetes bacterium]